MARTSSAAERARWAEARKQKVSEAQALLEQGVQNLLQDGQWQQFLAMKSRMRNYSTNNVLLILMQCPESTYVAGYEAWKKLGRQVRKGEKSIRILAPMKYKSLDEATGEETVGIRGFTTAAVFDISQTDGPDVEVGPKLLSGAGSQEVWDSITADLAADGFVVERGDCGGPNGYVTWDAKTVRVRDDVDELQALKTLIHERAHVLLNHRGYERPLAEVEAESVAFVVMNVLGLDAIDYSYPYVADWSNGDLGVIKATADRVNQTAHEILERIQHSLTKEEVAA